MSRRPLWADPVRRAGDVRRRLWSESPIPRQATRRVRAVGVPAPVFLCSNPEMWTLTGSTSTSAAYTGSLGYVALTVRIDFDCTHAGTVTPEVRVYRDGEWSAWSGMYFPATISGPATGSRSADFGGGGVVTGIEVRWDVPGAFATLCATAVDAQ